MFCESAWVGKPLPPDLFASQQSLRLAMLCTHAWTVLDGVHGVLENGEVSGFWTGDLVSFVIVCYPDDVL